MHIVKIANEEDASGVVSVFAEMVEKATAARDNSRHIEIADGEEVYEFSSANKDTILRLSRMGRQMRIAFLRVVLSELRESGSSRMVMQFGGSEKPLRIIRVAEEPRSFEVCPG